MSPPATEENYSVVWSDDFHGPSGSSPDTSKWVLKADGPNSGNNEVQTYTSLPSNVSLSGTDTLQITPQKDTQGHWTSARLESTFAYACPPTRRMLLQAEIRIGTAPYAQQAGIWPAFWALGASFRPDVFKTPGVDWPECGEWDIMETAHGANWTLASLHYGAIGGGAKGPEYSRGGTPGTSVQRTFDVTQFHTYALRVDRSDADWQKEQMEWVIDGERWFGVTGADVGDQQLWENVAHKPFFPVLNVAVGSNFPSVGGQPDGDTAEGLGSGLQVNYVAFYQSN